jgi:hypothetical protein
MRKDKSTAVILNQLIQPEAILVPAKSENEGGGRAFVFEAEDYATGALLKATFAVRFKVEPVAAEFQKTYVEAQERNRSVFALEAAAARASSSAAAAAAAAAGTSGGISQAALNAASTPVSASAASSAAAGGSGAGATPAASRQEEVGHVQPLTDALLAATDMGAVPTIKEEEEGEGDDEADDDGESAVTAEPPTVLVVEGGAHGADRGTASTAPSPIKVSAAPAPGTSSGSSGGSSNDSPAAASKAGSEAGSGGTVLVLVLVGAAAVAGLVWADGKGLLEGPKAEARKALQAAREAVQAHHALLVLNVLVVAQVWLSTADFESHYYTGASMRSLCPKTLVTQIFITPNSSRSTPRTGRTGRGRARCSRRGSRRRFRPYRDGRGR